MYTYPIAPSSAPISAFVLKRRGRGGVVENIFIERIRMREIDGDAISFNLYYEGKAGSGEYQTEAMSPVTEETPCSEILSFRILCAARTLRRHQRLAGDAGGELDGEAVGNHKS